MTSLLLDVARKRRFAFAFLPRVEGEPVGGLRLWLNWRVGGLRRRWFFVRCWMKGER